MSALFDWKTIKYVSLLDLQLSVQIHVFAILDFLNPKMKSRFF
jgi:hypothetical protein